MEVWWSWRCGGHGGVGHGGVVVMEVWWSWRCGGHGGVVVMEV